jgi:dipeptidyl aminopeptidase/acylaminoacyl peptidase
MVSTDGTQKHLIIAEGSDFYMQPCWHPFENRVAWIEWNHPDMPWDRSSFMIADLVENKGKVTVGPRRRVAGENAISHFQPEFSPNGRYLSVVSDETGWFNLKILCSQTFEVIARVKDEAEHGSAAWTQGMRTYVWSPDSSAVFFLRSKEAFAELRRFDLAEESTSTIGNEMNRYSSLKQISISPAGDRLTMIGSASSIPPRIISVSLKGEVEVHRCSGDSLPDSHCSEAHAVEWNSGEETCYGLYYPPTNPDFEDSGLPPAVIKIHGGPTSQYNADYSADTQFFTSRGYAVLAVNYRGSTGYGRRYRNALQGSWGVKDVEDISSAAEFLICKKLANEERIVLVGGSAGGYNLLMCFVRYPEIFRAGICRYGVSDLKALAEDTHKFEEHYLDSLIGILPRDEEIYRERSPISHSERIQTPLAIFQGNADQVVPQTQSDMIVTSLERRNIPNIYRVYEGEGHGWRKLETIQDYYETVDKFLRKYVLD